MRNVQLASLSVDQLVGRFAEIGVEQDKALQEGQIAKFNRLFRLMGNVSTELRGRDSDQRRALMALYSYPNMQVRLKAAIHTLAVAPHEARHLIEEIAATHWYPQAGDAGMRLDALESGIFKPS